MITLESAHIEEVRGIRKLDIDFQKGTFAISGPNGSGKSGVIDAIEFALTGQISRLAGRGTKGLSLAEHGPHVDKTKHPGAAFVELKIYLPDIKKSVTVTRKVSDPKKPRIVPADDDVKRILAEIADHPEITLSRREILRFILVEPTTRSEEIQTILKLDEIGLTRAALNTAHNRLRNEQRTADALVESSRDALLLHLQTATLRTAELLDAVNQRRRLLGVAEIAELTADTKLDADLSEAAIQPGFNKQSALRDLNALSEGAKGFGILAGAEVDAIRADLSRLESDPAMVVALQRRALIEKGLDLVDGLECPLCDTAWADEQHLREHLKAKLAKSAEAQGIQESLLRNGAVVAQEAVSLIGLLTQAQRIAEAHGDPSTTRLLAGWKSDLDGLKARLTTLEGLTGVKDRLTAGWVATPPAFLKSLQHLVETVRAKPDQTAALDARTFLTTAQVRRGDFKEAQRRSAAAGIAVAAAKEAYDTYCGVLEDELNDLYDKVEKDFSTFYRAINGDDEAAFTAKLTPSEGKLDLAVNFYERGLFPPAAFHSEGHQDGMGVCLYLALMRQLFAERFTFALLDDVVMSVDAGHRYQFCKLLKASFPGTQFIITTHDRLWAEQMKSAGLVTAKRSLAFHSWSVDTGPLVESSKDIWAEIAACLAKGKVEAAAAALRHHLEFVSRLLADQLGAKPAFRADGNYELGDLLPSVLHRMNELCGRAADAAQSWGKSAEKSAAASRKGTLSTASGVTNVEQWAVNKAVHYNEWANFGRKDFEPVVEAFRQLVECFRCGACDSWLYVTPRTNPESLRCVCSAINLNLKRQPD